MVGPALFVLAPPEALGPPLAPWIGLGGALLGVLAVALWPAAVASRALASAGLATFVGLEWVVHPESPARGMLLLVGATLVLAMLWPDARLQQADGQQGAAVRRVRWEPMAVALFAGTVAWLAPSVDREAPAWVLSALYLLTLVVGRRVRSTSALSRVLEVGALGLALVPLLDVVPGALAQSIAPFGTLSPLLLFARESAEVASAPLERAEGWMDAILVDPARLLVLSFATISAVGTLALSLPVSATRAGGLAVVDAAFMAVSATCVTGLVVVDTPTALTGFGELVVLALIQVGGLGIMVFSTSAAAILGQRLSLRYERTAVAVVGASSRAGLADTVRRVLLVTLATEGLVALVLFIRFLVRGEAAGQAAWRAVFTAVSAFCNAGFALQTDSLMSYAGDAWVMSAVGLAVVVGGLGPAVVFGVISLRRTVRPSLHLRLVLGMTAILIAVPTVFFAALEYHGAMARPSWLGTVGQALFHAITLRTAGFNAVDPAALQPASFLLMLCLMFVGGNPGSTAGGIKTTTLAVLALHAWSVVAGRPSATIFGRTVPESLLRRAVAVLLLSCATILAGLGMLLLTQDMPFDMALFEAVSAVGTVGLSIGGTARLDEVGKVVIIACMFAGRVGPLALLSFLFSRARVPRVGFPSESVPLG